eukprot:755167-Hanusia_phi.AAC.10
MNSALSYSHAQKKPPHASVTNTIIENAKRIEEKASEIAGERRAKPAGLTLAHKVSAELRQQIQSHVIDKPKTPFAKDRDWSVEKEKNDMDSFYDNLDNHAAVKELEARKKNTRDAILHETVLKTNSELKMIQHDDAKKAQSEQETGSKAKAKGSDNHAFPRSDGTSKKKFSSSRARSDINGFYDNLIHHVTAGQSDESQMSDAAARKQEKQFFSKMAGESDFPVHDSVNVHLSSDAARSEISAAEHENPPSERKERPALVKAAKTKSEMKERSKNVLEKIEEDNGKEAAKSRLEKKFKQQKKIALK